MRRNRYGVPGILSTAIEVVAKKILLSNSPTAGEIENKMIELANQQLLHTASMYVKSEIYFQAGNFDISPKITIDQTTRIMDIKCAMNDRKNQMLADYNTAFSESKIEERLTYWHTLLQNSIKTAWSKEARKFFVGKRMLKEIQAWLFGTRNILLWEHIINSEESACVDCCKELRDILGKI